MKLPRKGILIRLLIYLPLIAFLSWRAFGPQLFDPPAPEGRRRTISGPDGREIQVIELTPAEAEQRFGKLPEMSAGTPDPSDSADAPVVGAGHVAPSP